MGELWENAFDAIHVSASCAWLNIIKFKVLHRIHFCKARLTKIYPNLSDIRDRRSPADFTHMFWSHSSLVQKSFLILHWKRLQSQQIVILGTNGLLRMLF